MGVRFSCAEVTHSLIRCRDTQLLLLLMLHLLASSPEYEIKVELWIP